jgi:hypothetical protein
LIKGISLDERGLIRGAALGERGLIRGISLDERGLIRTLSEFSIFDNMTLQISCYNQSMR